MAGLVLMAREASTGETHWVGTDTDGVFEFPGLPPGQYQVSAPGAGRLRGGPLTTEVVAGERARISGLWDAGGASLRGTVPETPREPRWRVCAFRSCRWIRREEPAWVGCGP